MIKIDNVFNRSQRLDLLKLCKPLCRVMKDYPASQSNAYIHNDKDIKPYIRIIKRKIEFALERDCDLSMVWVNEDRGYKKDIFWHTHPGYNWTAVYYMKTIPYINSGTLFEEEGFVRMKQNSMLLFPGWVKHGTPSYPFHWIKRYSIAMDIELW